jgi:mannan endo-1,4-beta-mannosidase
VIENAAKDTKAVITVEKLLDGTVTSAKATVTRMVTASGNNSKVSIPGIVTEQIKEAAGQNDVEITVKAVDESGKTKYKLNVNAKNLKSGKKLYVYAKDTDTGEYTMVNGKVYTVSEAGTIHISLSKKAMYDLLTAAEAKKISREILATIAPEETNKTLEKGETTNFTLSNSCNTDNIKKITYSSSNKKVATVSKKGKITAKGAGTAVIKAKVTLKNGKKKTVKMTVEVPAPMQTTDAQSQPNG